jgi:5-formyltetrahydrofolate cyclo-ligase
MTEPSKSELRARLRAARDAFVRDLAPAERAALAERAAAHLAPLLDAAGRVAFYQAVGSELDCRPAIAAAAARGIASALPRIEDGGAMRFLAWSPGDPLEAGWRGLLQPATDAVDVSPDIIVAPLLGFDSALSRLGQGGGFYDRAFAAHPGARRIGFGWSIQQAPAIGCDPWDVPLDAVVTEAGVLVGDEAR